MMSEHSVSQYQLDLIWVKVCFFNTPEDCVPETAHLQLGVSVSLCVFIFLRSWKSLHHLTLALCHKALIVQLCSLSPSLSVCVRCSLPVYPLLALTTSPLYLTPSPFILSYPPLVSCFFSFFSITRCLSLAGLLKEWKGSFLINSISVRLSCSVPKSVSHSGSFSHTDIQVRLFLMI